VQLEEPAPDKRGLTRQWGATRTCTKEGSLLQQIGVMLLPSSNIARMKQVVGYNKNMHQISVSVAVNRRHTFAVIKYCTNEAGSGVQQEHAPNKVSVAANRRHPIKYCTNEARCNKNMHQRDVSITANRRHMHAFATIKYCTNEAGPTAKDIHPTCQRQPKQGQKSPQV